MNSLFRKLFGSFVFITLLATVTTGVISYWAQVGPYGELIKRIQHHQFQTLNHFVTVAGIAVEKIAASGGEDSVQEYLEKVEGSGIGHIFLVHSNGTSFSGRSLPAGATDLAAASARSAAVEYNISDTEVMVALPVSGPELQDYVVLGTMERIFWPKVSDIGQSRMQRPGPLPLGLPLLVMLLIAGGGCYLLARSLTAPVRRLRHAAQKIAEGDFSARVDTPGSKGDEIADLSRDFNLMVEKTEALIQARTRLLRDISHELRSPLTRLNLALQMVRQRPDKADNYLDRIAKESERVDVLIGQLLMLTRMEGGMDSGSCQPVNLKKLIRDIVQDADFEAAAGQGAGLGVLCLEDVTVAGDEELISRALENVIRNGLHYTYPGTVVEIQLTRTEEVAVARIRDCGPGVAEGDLENIFKPFFRISASRGRDSGGTGVGLAIARGAIQMYGGTIHAKNCADGTGLIVEITLPLFQEDGSSR